MKLAQDYLKTTESGATLGGFNSRLDGDSFSETVSGTTNDGYNDRASGWQAADNMIKKGLIFSKLRLDSGDKVEFKCMADGSAWLCFSPNFINLQESDCYAYGDTRQEAIENFLKLGEPNGTI